MERQGQEPSWWGAVEAAIRSECSLADMAADEKLQIRQWQQGGWEPRLGEIRWYLWTPGEAPIRAPLLVVGRWMEEAGPEARRVAVDEIEGCRVSTVFLGLDHGFPGLEGDRHEPVLFETMVFGGPLDQEQERYGTEAAARTGHQEMVERVRAAERGEGR